MRIISLCLLPLLAGAFAPAHHQNAALRNSMTTRHSSLIAEPDAVTDVTGEVNSKLQTVLEKADDLLLKRAMRFVNHAPIIVTLGTLLSQCGSTKFGFDIAPSALSFAAPAGLAVPTWIGYALPAIVVTQVAAVLRSSLADDRDELTQENISAMAVSNFALTRALGASSPLNWAIAAVASGYYARNGHGDDEPNVSNISIQITSSLASVATVLGVAAQLPKIVPILSGRERITAAVGLLGYFGLATREGNGTVKKVVNACVMGGILVSKVASGALNFNNLMRIDTVITLATAYVAALSVDKARQALA